MSGYEPRCGEVLDLNGNVLYQLVHYEPCAEPFDAFRNGNEPIKVIGYALDVAGHWHPVVLTADSPVPETWHGGEPSRERRSR